MITLYCTYTDTHIIYKLTCVHIYIYICIIYDVHAYTLYVYILDAYVCMYIYIYA